MSKILINDDVSVVIEATASLFDCKAVFVDINEFAIVWDQIMANPINTLDFVNDSELVVGHYDNVLLDSTKVESYNGGVMATFRFREKTRIEVRLDELENTQNIQDEAIVELADIIA